MRTQIKRYFQSRTTQLCGRTRNACTYNLNIHTRAFVVALWSQSRLP